MISTQQTQPKAAYQPDQIRETVGDSLFVQGYRAYVKDACTLFVRKPDGTHYIINPYAQTCTCQAGRIGRRCKHLKGLTDLVFLSAAALEWKENFAEAGKLYDYWTDFSFWHNRQGGAR